MQYETNPEDIQRSRGGGRHCAVRFSVAPARGARKVGTGGPRRHQRGLNRVEIQAGRRPGDETRRLARSLSPAFRARRCRWRTARSSRGKLVTRRTRRWSSRGRFMDIARPRDLGCILRQLLGESGRELAVERRKSFGARQDSVLRYPPGDRMRMQEPARARGVVRAAGGGPTDPDPGLIVMPQIGNTVPPVGAPARRASEPPAMRSRERAGSVFGRTVSRNPDAARAVERVASSVSHADAGTKRRARFGPARRHRPARRACLRRG